MQAIKCELCGSNEFTKVDGLFQCNHCNTKYTLEEAKKLIVTGTIEVVTGNAEKERLLKNAETYICLQRYDDALNLYNQIAHKYPNDYRGWWGLVITDFYRTEDDNYFHSDKGIRFDAFKATYSLTKNKDFIFEFIDKIIDTYGNELRLSAVPFEYQTFTKKEKANYIDEFTRWLIFNSKKICNLIKYDKLNNFIKHISAKYEHLAKEGEIFPCISAPYGVYIIEQDFSLKFRDDNDNPIINFAQVFEHYNYDSKSIVNLFNNIMHNIDSTKYARDYTEYQTDKRKNFFIHESGFKFFGKWLFISGGSFDNTTYINKLPVIVDKALLFQSGNFCQHCGGEFKGLFKKVCSKCGKPKDY